MPTVGWVNCSKLRWMYLPRMVVFPTPLSPRNTIFRVLSIEPDSASFAIAVIINLQLTELIITHPETGMQEDDELESKQMFLRVNIMELGFDTDHFTMWMDKNFEKGTPDLNPRMRHRTLELPRTPRRCG